MLWLILIISRLFIRQLQLNLHLLFYFGFFFFLDFPSILSWRVLENLAAILPIRFIELHLEPSCYNFEFTSFLEVIWALFEKVVPVTLFQPLWFLVGMELIAFVEQFLQKVFVLFLEQKVVWLLFDFIEVEEQFIISFQLL